MLARAKGIAAHVLQLSASRLQPPLTCHSPSRLECLVEVEGEHIFIGYYDIQPFDHAGQTILAHAVADGSEQARVGVVDLETAYFRTLATTPCWCWQLGARLQRWDSKHIVFNTMDQAKPSAHIVDLSGRVVSKLPWNIFALDKERKRAAIVDFGRLYRHRPGYGYKALAAPARGSGSEWSNGIAIVNLAARDLQSFIDVDQAWNVAFEHGAAERQSKASPRYLNHPLFSPDGKRLVFLLVVEIGRTRKIAMMVSRVDTGKVETVLPHHFSSHNWWIDNSKILVFLYGDGRRGRYAIWNIDSGTLTSPGTAWPEFDGHPSLAPGGMRWATDTYPDLFGNQRLFVIPALHSTHAVEVARFRTPLGMTWDKCDLHPRLAPDGRLIAVDTAFSGCRQIAVLDVSSIHGPPS